MKFAKKKDDFMIDKESDITENAERFARSFMERYAPYALKDYVITPRGEDEMPDLDGFHPGLNAMSRKVEASRAADPMIGVKLASQEIFVNVANSFKSERGVQTEQLLAALGAIGGRVCADGLMSTIDQMVSNGAKDRAVIINAAAMSLGMMVVKTQSGELYLMGDRIGNEFVVFMSNAMGEKIDPRVLVPLSSTCASACGGAEYWDTPFNEVVGADPKKAADTFAGVFKPTFLTYCRFPQERMLAVALAAQKAVGDVVKQQVMERERAAAIIAEYGWRTSHFWKEG